MAQGTTNDGGDGYNAADNSAKCYTLAIRCLRLDAIRSGKATPDPNDPEELAAAREAGFVIVEAQPHRVSA